MGATNDAEHPSSGRSNPHGPASGRVARLTDSLHRAGLIKAVFSAFAVVLVVVAGVFVVLAMNTNALLHDAARNGRSDEVLAKANASERLVIDLETGLRGYLLTNQFRLLRPYFQAHGQLAEELPRLQALLGGSPSQLARAQAIARAVAHYERSYADPLIAAKGGLTQSQKVASALAGKPLIDDVRGLFASFDRRQRVLSSERRRETASGAKVTTIVAGGGFALVALLLAGLAAYLGRAVLMPIRRVATAAGRLGQGELNTRVPQRGPGEVGALALAFNSMSRMLEDRERTVRVTGERFQGILDNANAAIYIKDADGHFLVVNGEFERVRALTADEVLGRTEHDIAPAETADQIRARDRMVIETGTPMTFEQDIPKADGLRTFLSVKFPVHSENGVVTAIAGISTDITDLKHALGEAVKVSRHKSEFVANMSHEIRTPLNGVVGMTSLLRETSLDTAQREYAAALEASSEALLSVINDILDFSKIEAGRLELDPTDFELQDTVEEACLMLVAQARAKDLEIKHWLEADVPASVHGDRGRLRQILLNLLSNAVKFTASGEILVHVFGAGEDMVRFEVSDTGVGINEDQAAHLFDSFVQADQSTTRQYGGTGLGLAISRELAHRMGGEVGAEPGVARGSVFWFTARLPAASMRERVAARSELSALPTKPIHGSPLYEAIAETIASAPPGTRPEHNGKARRQPGGPLVLIAEDNEINHVVAKALLIKQGLRTAVAHNGREAVEMALAQDYAAILMDCQMPELDGYEATRQIRAAENGYHVPIIAMTAHSMPGDRERCLASGMDDYISKPVRAEDLKTVMARSLPARRPPATETSSTVDPHSSDVAQNARDRTELLHEATIVQLRDEFTLEMRESLMSAFDASLPRCMAGILSAAERGDQIELRRVAHLLKGSAATLGASRLRLACQRLEHTGRAQDREIDDRQLEQLKATASETGRSLRAELLHL